MISYVTVCADRIARAIRFYSTILPALGYELEEGPEGLSYALPVQSGQSPVLPEFCVKPTFDGRPASAGNGSMVAFEARNQKQVRDLHAAALFAGGTDEAPQCFRASYGPQFLCWLPSRSSRQQDRTFLQQSQRTGDETDSTGYRGGKSRSSRNAPTAAMGRKLMFRVLPGCLTIEGTTDLRGRPANENRW